MKLSSELCQCLGPLHTPLFLKECSVLLKIGQGFKVGEPWEGSVIYTIIAFVLNMTYLKISCVK